MTTLLMVVILHYQFGQSFQLLPLELLNEKMMSKSIRMAGELDAKDILDLKLTLLQAIHDMKSVSLKQLQTLGKPAFRNIIPFENDK